MNDYIYIVHDYFEDDIVSYAFASVEEAENYIKVYYENCKKNGFPRDYVETIEADDDYDYRKIVYTNGNGHNWGIRISRVPFVVGIPDWLEKQYT